MIDDELFFSMLQGGFLLYLIGLSLGLLMFATEILGGCFSRMKNRSIKEKNETVTKFAFI